MFRSLGSRKSKVNFCFENQIFADPITKSNLLNTLLFHSIAGGDSFVGKLRSNMLGTQFTIYDGGEPRKVRAGLLGERPGQRQEIVGVLYDTNVLGFKGPRRMTGVVCC